MIQNNELVSTGNALRDGKRGWFVGQFVAPALGLIRQETLEIKWGQHPKGDKRKEFAQYEHATTISVLIYGSFAVQLRLPDQPEETREVLLSTPGDYLAFGPKVDHSWEAHEESLVITVRFPSIDYGHG